VRHWCITIYYCLDVVPLDRVYQVKDLGIFYVPTLDFHPHVDYIVNKSLRVLGFIRRHSRKFRAANCLLALYNASVRSILEYGAMLPYTATDIRRIHRVQNKFLSFAGFTLGITHQPHDYGPVILVLGLDNLEERRKYLGTRFILGLLNGRINAPRLLERLSIRVPCITRSQDFFYLPLGRTNFMRNAPLDRMMHDFNNHLST
jgi:hypothetical protein